MLPFQYVQYLFVLVLVFHASLHPVNGAGNHRSSETPVCNVSGDNDERSKSNALFSTTSLLRPPDSSDFPIRLKEEFRHTPYWRKKLLASLNTIAGGSGSGNYNRQERNYFTTPITSSDNNNNDGTNPNTIMGGKDEVTIAKESKPPKEQLFKYAKKKGRINVNMSPGYPPVKIQERQRNNNNRTIILPLPFISSPGQPLSDDDLEILSVSVDPFAAMRFLRFLYLASSSFLGAFLGTLKLLGPLIFARRVLAQFGELVSDYMMGRYLRTTYDYVERKYWKEYQGPAASRSLARCLCHGILLSQLGKVMEWWLGLGSAPCVISKTGRCHWWCGLLWIVSVVGTGNLGALVVSTVHVHLNVHVTTLN